MFHVALQTGRTHHFPLVLYAFLLYTKLYLHDGWKGFPPYSLSTWKDYPKQRELKWYAQRWWLFQFLTSRSVLLTFDFYLYFTAPFPGDRITLLLEILNHPNFKKYIETEDNCFGLTVSFQCFNAPIGKTTGIQKFWGVMKIFNLV